MIYEPDPASQIVSPGSVANRVGMIYEWNPFIFVGMLTCIANFPSERNVYLRERHDKGYSAFSFLGDD